MENNNFSAIRLPNTCLLDYAGTEVGSDLIILQKNTAKPNLTEAEELFYKATKQDMVHPAMLYLRTVQELYIRIESRYWLYGQPALIYTLIKIYVEGIANAPQRDAFRRFW